MQDASFYTLDPDTGCGIRDVSNGGLLVWAAPGSAQGGSVTYAGTDDELATWNGDGVRWECSAAAGGVLSCTMSGNNINTPYYGLQRPDGSTVSPPWHSWTWNIHWRGETFADPHTRFLLVSSNTALAG